MFLLVNTLGRTSVVLNINCQILGFILRGSLTPSNSKIKTLLLFIACGTFSFTSYCKNFLCNQTWHLQLVYFFSLFSSPYCFKIYWYQKAKFLLIMLENERDNCIKNFKNLCQLPSSNSWISFMSDASAAILSSCKKSKETVVSCY